MKSFIRLFFILLFLTITSRAYTQSFSEDPILQDLIVKAQNFEKEGNFVGAIKAYEKVLQTESQNLYSLSHIALLKGKMGRYEEQRDVSQSLIQSYPQFDLAYVFLAESYLGLGKLDLAEEQLKQSIKLRPNSPLAHYYLGLVGEMKKDSIEALNSYKKAIEESKLFEVAYERFAALSIKIHSKKENKKILKEFVYLFPNNQELKDLSLKLGLK